MTEQILRFTPEDYRHLAMIEKLNWEKCRMLEITLGNIGWHQLSFLFISDIDDKNATNGHFFTDSVETFCRTIGNVWMFKCLYCLIFISKMFRMFLLWKCIDGNGHIEYWIISYSCFSLLLQFTASRETMHLRLF